MLLDVAELHVFELVKDLGGLTLFIGGSIYIILYLRKQNDRLVEKLETSHEARESKLMEVIKDGNLKHEQCTQRYFELSSRWQDVVANNTNTLDKVSDAVDRLAEKIDDIK